jgi:hypothetical protein
MSRMALMTICIVVAILSAMAGCTIGVLTMAMLAMAKDN